MSPSVFLAAIVTPIGVAASEERTVVQRRKPGATRRYSGHLALALALLAGSCAWGAGASVGAAATAMGPQRCGSLNVPAKPLPGSTKSSTFHFVHITAIGLSCAEAKAVLRGLGNGAVPAGWKLTNGHLHEGPYPLEGIMRRGRDTITYRYACGGC
jgi:hypothetical protein